MKNERDIVEHLAKKYNKRESFVEELISHQTTFIADSIRALQPRILIHGLGSYNVSKYKLKKKIATILRLYRKGVIKRETCVEQITPLWKLKQKLNGVN